MARETDEFRTLNEGDEAILEDYARAIQASKDADAHAKSLRDQVWEILSREDTEKTLVHSRFVYEVSYRRGWSPRLQKIEREIDVNGQMIIASVDQLKNASSRLTKLLQTPDMEAESSVAITARLL